MNGLHAEDYPNNEYYLPGNKPTPIALAPQQALGAKTDNTAAQSSTDNKSATVKKTETNLAESQTYGHCCGNGSDSDDHCQYIPLGPMPFGGGFGGPFGGFGGPYGGFGGPFGGFGGPYGGFGGPIGGFGGPFGGFGGPNAGFGGACGGFGRPYGGQGFGNSYLC